MNGTAVLGRASHELHESYYGELLQEASDLIQLVDPDGSIFFVNRSWCETLGYTAAEAQTLSIGEVMHPDCKEPCCEKFRSVMEGETLRDLEVTFLRKDGENVYLVGSARPRKDPNGRIVGTAGIFRDVTKEKRIAGELEESLERYEQLVRQIRAVAWEVDASGLYTYVGATSDLILGLAPEEIVGHLHFYDLFPEDCREALKAEAFVNFARKEPFQDFLNEVQTPSGERLMLSTTALPVLRDDGSMAGYRGLDFDVTEFAKQQEQIEFLSFRDALTGVYNRRYIDDAMKRLDQERNLPFALMVIDVDGLKLTNDAFGHDTGDKLLQKAAAILQSACRADDIIGRAGGDEFTILLPRTSRAAAKEVKRRILEAAAQERVGQVPVSFAVGYAVKTSRGETLDSIRILADNNMYKNKLKYGKAMRLQTLEIVLSNLHTRYGREMDHSERVSELAVGIAELMRLPSHEIQSIRQAGRLHDIGKIMVPPELLTKAGPLTEDEMRIVKRHAEIGYRILKAVNEYAPLADYVLYHHERWDGNGYPEGLAREEIPLISRILCVADSFEAMTGGTPNRPKLSEAEARAEILACAGTQFDPFIAKLI